MRRQTSRKWITLVLGLVCAAGPAWAQWEILPSGSTADLRAIDAVGNGVAWASGTQGTVLRTTDGGKTWQRCATPPGAEGLDFRGVQAFDASTAIVMSSGKGDMSRLYRTSDGCQSWTLFFTNPDPDGFFDTYKKQADDSLEQNPGDGFVLGDPVDGRFSLWHVGRYKSSGFEVTRDPNRPKSRKGETAFAASNSSIFSQSTFETSWIATGREDGSRVIRVKLHDLGDGVFWYTYPSAKVPVAHGSASAGIFSIEFRPDAGTASKAARQYHVGIVVGGDYQKIGSPAGTSALTLDGGKTWTAARTLPHGFRSAVVYDEESKTWITVGPNGTDVSVDDGRNWRALRPDAAAGDAADADQHWNALSLPFVVGPGGRIGKLRAGVLKGAVR